MRDIFAYAARALGGHHLRTGLSVLGVSIGVAAVLVLTSLGEGARRYVTNEFASLGSNLLIVLPGKVETSGAAPFVGGVAHDLTLEDAAYLKKTIPGVTEVTPIVLGTAGAEAGKLSRDVTVVGSSASMARTHGLSVAVGSFLPDETFDYDARVCVLGSKVARDLFPGKIPVGDFIRIGGHRFRVIGVVAPRGTMLGVDFDEIIEVPAAAALRIFNQRSLFRILTEVRSNDDIERVKKAISATIAKRHEGEDDVTVFTQEALLSTFQQILGILTLALAGIAAVSLSVAGIGIMNVMLVSVSERTSEVGLLKALGASPRQITRVFLVEAAIMSLIGGAVGTTVGYALAWSVRLYFPDFPATPPIWAVGAALVVSIVVGIVFGLLPARRAAQLDPIAALGRRS